jgi:DNA-directed RNA polymerase subunit omega
MTQGEDNNFRYVVMAARRARQLQNGSQPLIFSRSNKACRVAQEEIDAGKVKAAEGQPLPEPAPDYSGGVGVALDLSRPHDLDS